MGRANIISGGTNGLYTVQLDFGQATRDARVAAVTAQLATLVTELATAQAALDAAQATEDSLKAAVTDAINAYVAAQAAVGAAFTAVGAATNALAALQSQPAPDPEDLAAAQTALTQAQADYSKATAAVSPALQAHTTAATQLMQAKQKKTNLSIPRNMLAHQQTQLQKDLATWQALSLTQTTSAWCADLTEDATGTVATIDIPGENALVLIAPAAPAPTAADGQLTAREVQTPSQVFWNAAVLPGWQKWKPTYRTGTITALDEEADTASVTLQPATSSAQNLDINQTTNLTAVPIVYMTCNAAAFKVGDQCVVQFVGQSQDAPRVVGFKTFPRPCGPEFVLLPIFEKMPTAWIEDGSYLVFDSVTSYVDSLCSIDSDLVYTSTATVNDNYLLRKIVAGGLPYIPDPLSEWTAAAVPEVTLWDDKHGVIQGSPIPSPVPVAHRSHNKSWVVNLSWAGLSITSRTWPSGSFTLPNRFTTWFADPPCQAVDVATAVAHTAYTSILFDDITGNDVLGFPAVIPTVTLIDTSNFEGMAAFFGAAEKLPPTVTITKGEKSLAYVYDGLAGQGAWGGDLWARYKRPAAS